MVARKNRRRLAGAVLAGLAIASAALFFAQHPSSLSADLAPPSPAQAPSPSSSTPVETASGSLAAVAASLPLVDEAAAIPDYRRDDFGSRWADIDNNGCDQRQDVLARDLVDVTRDRCTVLSGMLHDPYTGETVAFQHDRIAEPGSRGSQGVQIDHIVSLSAAHTGGAWRWDAADRERFANSLSGLLATDGRINESKGDRGPSEWMPAEPQQACNYAQRYTEIVAKWRLSVRKADRDALTRTLADCG